MGIPVFPNAASLTNSKGVGLSSFLELSPSVVEILSLSSCKFPNCDMGGRGGGGGGGCSC